MKGQVREPQNDTYTFTLQLDMIDMKKLNHLPITILLITLAVILLAACEGPPDLQTDKIAFESYRDGNAEVYVMDANGENLVRLTEDPAYDGVPSWSPDGQSLAFTSERNANPDIYVMGADGGNIQQLTEGDGVFNVVPAWSPDGVKIAFVSNRLYNEEQQGGSLEVEANAKLWTMDSEGDAQERITSRLGLDMFASWSPDSQSLVFMSIRDNNPEIYMLKPDTNEVNLTNHPARDINPSWSPDGKNVAFMSDREGNMEIFLMNLEDRSVRNISQHPAADGDPAWSPDGTQLAFISDRDGNAEIYIMSADGSNVRRITNDPADDIQPTWRPRQAP